MRKRIVAIEAKGKENEDFVVTGGIAEITPREMRQGSSRKSLWKS